MKSHLLNSARDGENLLKSDQSWAHFACEQEQVVSSTIRSTITGVQFAVKVISIGKSHQSSAKVLESMKKRPAPHVNNAIS